LLVYRDAKMVFHPRYLNTCLAKTSSDILNRDIGDFDTCVHSIFDWICMMHRLELVKLLNLDRVYRHNAVFHAAYSNNYDITDYLINNEYSRYGAVRGAAWGGHLELLIHLQPTRDDLYSIFNCASQGGHTHILRHFHSLYPDQSSPNQNFQIRWMVSTKEFWKK